MMSSYMATKKKHYIFFWFCIFTRAVTHDLDFKLLSVGNYKVGN